MRLLLAALGIAALAIAGCNTSTACAGVGEACSVLCCVNLSCHPSANGGHCTKGCRCYGSSICAATTFEDGCPQGSACLALSSNGSGECVQLCDRSPCMPGQVLCSSPEDAGIRCELILPPDMAQPDLLAP